MLTSLALIFLCGLLLGGVFQKLKLPSLLGMIITGILLGPYVFSLLDDKILLISGELRQLALVVILMRAGLALDLGDLKKVGRPAFLMCFVPACFEIVGVVILAPLFLPISRIEACVLGSVLAAVSPAVIVPRMIKLMEEGRGKEHSIPQLILAGASVDDVFVIVLFTAFSTLAAGGEVVATHFLTIPIAIAIGIVIGGLVGWFIVVFFKRVHLRDSIKIIMLLSIAFLLLELEHRMEGAIPFSGLLAIMSMGIIIKNKYEALAIRLSHKYNKLWIAAELLLFVLVGATVDINYAMSMGLIAIVIVLGALVFRMMGVLSCFIKTKLTKKERIFCMIAYTPKATVQAAIGAIPLSMGLSCGPTVLTVAVCAILITAPLGALATDLSYQKLLQNDGQ